jgi:hypothetical protein
MEAIRIKSGCAGPLKAMSPRVRLAVISTHALEGMARQFRATTGSAQAYFDHPVGAAERRWQGLDARIALPSCRPQHH